MAPQANLMAHPIATIVIGFGAIMLAVAILRVAGIAMLWRFLGQLTP